MPNLEARHNQSNGKLNKIGAIAALCSVILTVVFPPLGMLAAVVSAAAWYKAGSHMEEHGDALEKEAQKPSVQQAARIDYTAEDDYWRKKVKQQHGMGIAH